MIQSRPKLRSLILRMCALVAFSTTCLGGSIALASSVYPCGRPVVEFSILGHDGPVFGGEEPDVVVLDPPDTPDIDAARAAGRPVPRQKTVRVAWTYLSVYSKVPGGAVARCKDYDGAVRDVDLPVGTSSCEFVNGVGRCQ